VADRQPTGTQRGSASLRFGIIEVAGKSSVERATASLYAVCMSRLDRITSDPAICHGKAVIRGLRYPVQTLLELMSSGMTVEEILADYEDLQREDLLAALEFAAALAGGQALPLDAA
jgi:uncharacterized protein (DUF433 family)